MTATPLRVLFHEENNTDLEQILGELRIAGYAVQIQKVATESELRDALDSGDRDVFISGLFSPELGGLSALKIAREKVVDLPVVLIADTVCADIEEALRLGANDYVLRQNLARIGSIVRRELMTRNIRKSGLRTESALAESDKKLALAASLLHAFVESVSEAVVMHDAAGKIIACNKQFLALAGVAEAEPAKMNWTDVADSFREKLTNPQPWDALQQSLLTLHPSRKIFDFANRRIEASVIPCTSGGKYVGAGWSLSDATARERSQEQRRKLERKLTQSQKMESLGVLAGGMAHDFNNLLAIMLNNAEIVRAGIGANDPVRRNMANLFGALEQASALVRQVLQFSLRDRQQKFLPLNLAEQIPALMQQVREEISAYLEKTTLRYETDGVAPAITGDTEQIRQVLRNLCLNAAQAAKDEPGNIVVRLSRALVSDEDSKAEPDLKPGIYAVLTVSDDGPGMRPETLARLFEPFFTTKPASTAGTGAGLGLAVVHGIVRAHAGVILATSALGKGTTFSLYFPANAAGGTASSDKEKCAAKASPAKAAPGKRILVVDDDDAIAFVTSEILSMLGFEPITFTEPKKALEAFRENPQMADLMLADVNMPELDGVVLSKNILDIRPDFPVLLLSGYSGPWTADAVRSIGITEMLAKPISADALGRAIHKALDATAKA